MSRVTIYIFATSNIAQKLLTNYKRPASDAKLNARTNCLELTATAAAAATTD